MKLTQSKIKDLMATITVDVKAVDYTENVDKVLKKYRKTAEVPGFRKGKAPINIVRKKYENNVLSESLDKLVQDKVKHILDEKKLKVFTQPKVDLKKYEKNEPIEVEIKIDLEPEIKLADFKKLKDELSDILISELDPINKEIKKLLNEETYIVEILRKGSDKASDISQPILQKTREIVGFLK